MIDVFKGIGLDPIEHILSKVSGKTAGGSGAGGASQGSEQEGQAGHEDEHEPVHGDDLHLTASLDAVSYTHLDVYKRQVYSIGIAAFSPYKLVG